MKKLGIKSFVDGVLNLVCFTFISFLSTSAFIESEVSMNALLVVACVNGGLMAVVYFLLLRKENSAKRVMAFSVFSLLVFAIGVVIEFACLISFDFQIPLQREMSNADGFLIVFSLGAFLIVNLLLRLVVLIALIVRRINALQKD